MKGAKKVERDQTEPTDVVDHLLWRNAQQMLIRHAAPGPDNTCVWCGWPWPCPPRRLAERAEQVARLPWPEAPTAGQDMDSSRGLSDWGADLGEAAVDHRHQSVLANRGSFD